MDAQEVTDSVAEGVRRLMAAQTPPWTQRELASRLGWSEGNVSRLLTARRGTTSVTLAQLATVFGVDVCELLCKSERAPTAKSAARPKGKKK
jgi:transcriptional regulator with XRE-family HTH domain